MSVDISIIKATIEINNPKQLIITIQQDNKSMTGALTFDDHLRSLYVKNWIEEACNNEIQRKVEEVKRFLINCESV